MRRPEGGAPEEVTPAGTNVRTRAHEYGGGAWHLAADDLVLFVDFADQRLYRQRLGEEPLAITPEPETAAGLRYADFRVTPDGGTIVCVREVHGDGEAENQIVALNLDGSGEPTVLASGRDFYSFPRVSPDGRQLAWTCWDHPNMPWDGTELWLAPLDDPGEAQLIVGGPEESIFQPEWDAEGRLHFVSDDGGWWNLYRLEDDAIEALTDEEADLAHPQWLFGGSTYRFLSDGSIVCIRCDRGEERLFLLEPGAELLADLEQPYTSFGFPSLAGRGMEIAFAAASPARETAVVLLDLASGDSEVVRSASEESIDGGYVSVPAPGRVPDQRRRDRPRLLLPADQPRLRRAGGGTAAADRAEPRRPHLARDPGARPRVPLSGPAAASASSTSTTAVAAATAAPTATACAAAGASSTPTTASPPPGTSPTAARPTSGDWRSAAAAPAATPPSAPSSSTTTSPPAPATTASPTPRRWPRTPTSSSRATWTA